MTDIFSNFRNETTSRRIVFITTQKSECGSQNIQENKTIFTINISETNDKIRLEYLGCNGITVFSETFEGLSDDFQERNSIMDILRGNIDLINPKFESYRLDLGTNTPFISFTGSSYFWGNTKFLEIRSNEKKDFFTVFPFRQTVSISGESWTSLIDGQVKKYEVNKNTKHPRFFENNLEISALNFIGNLQDPLSNSELAPIKKVKEIVKDGIKLLFPVTEVASNPAASQIFLNELIILKTQINQGQNDLALQKIDEYINAILTSRIIIQDKRNEE